MKIYVASHDRWSALHIAGVLSEKGHAITSRWVHQTFSATETYAEADRQRIAREDMEDVLAADMLVLVAGPDKYPGGKFVEAGIALGAGKRVVVIGRRENMLLWHPAIARVDDPREID